jgi:hypothetical protein
MSDMSYVCTTVAREAQRCGMCSWSGWSHKPLASNMSLPLMLGMLKEASETLGPQRDNTHASGLKYVVRFVYLGHLC